VLRHSFIISCLYLGGSDPSCVTTYPRGSSSRVFVIRLPSRSLGEGWCFVIRLSFIVVSELPKTAAGKVQKYVLRGKPAISKQ
jgi:hypothetical protein